MDRDAITRLLSSAQMAVAEAADHVRQQKNRLALLQESGDLASAVSSVTLLTTLEENLAREVGVRDRLARRLIDFDRAARDP
jgi:hypothetical protein